MKKGFALIDITLTIIILGLTAYTLASIITNIKDKGSKLLLEHVKDIETNALVAIEKEGTYTFDDLRLSIFLQETNDIKCESYTITEEKVLKAINCIYKDKEYCYDDDQVKLCSNEENSDIINYVLDDNSNSNNNTIDSKESKLEEKKGNKSTNKSKEEKTIVYDESKYIVDPVRSSNPEHNGGFIMPDIYNTGYTSNFNDLVELSVKYPLVTGCRITTKIAEAYNYVFEGFKTNCELLINGVDNVTIRNFYIENDSWYGIKLAAYNGLKTPENITITDGEIKGTKAAGILGSNVTIRRVYIHDYNADAIKLGSNQVIEANYIGSGGIGEGAHADGVQLTGTCVNTIIRGNRFDMVAIPNGSYKANANIFLKLESGYSDGVVVQNNWLNGGGYTTYIVRKDEVDGKFTNLTYAYNKLGNGYRFGLLSYDSRIPVNGMDTQIKMDDIKVPSIGSVIFFNYSGWRIGSISGAGSDMRVFVNSANYTSEDLPIKIVALAYNQDNKLLKIYETTNTIPRNITGKETVGNYSLTINSFPFNVGTDLNINDIPNSTQYIKVKIYSNNYELRTETIWR